MTKQRFSLNILQQGLIIVLLPVVLQIGIIVVLYGLQNQLEQETEKAYHSSQVVKLADETAKEVYYGLRDTRDWMSSLAGLGGGLRALAQLLQKTDERLDKLRLLVQNNPGQLQILDETREMLRSLPVQMLAVRKAAAQGDLERANQLGRALVDDCKPKSKKAIDALFLLVQKERQIEQESPAVQARFREETKQTLFIAVLIDLLLAVLLAVTFARRVAARLKTLMDNSVRLARGQPLTKPLSGSDEIAVLDRSFREMAEALEHSQSAERALVENAQEVICSLSADWQFINVNRACAAVWGYEASELIGSRVVRIIYPDDVARALAYFEQLKDGAEMKPLEIRITCKDGAVRTFLWSLRWETREKSLFCVVHDITERKEIERMKQEFVEMVSHDLRSPLCSIQAFTQMLETGYYGQLTDTGKETLQFVNSSSDRLIQLVGDLIDIDKLESGMMELDLQRTKLSSVFREAKHSVESLASSQQKNIVCEDNGIQLLMDGDRMIQVIVNLLGNAIKFSPAGSEIRVVAQEIDDSVEILVIDQGRGIPAEMLESVFARFKQVSTADAKKRKGSGLGLAICKAIVEQHGGKIGVKSEVERGSTFWIHVPKGPE